MPNWPPKHSSLTSTRHIHTLHSHYGTGHNISNHGSTAWPSNNLAIYMPVVFDQGGVVSQFIVANGATASGNVDVGLFTLSGVKLGSTGAVAQSGVNTLQFINVSGGAFTVGPGTYYLGLSLSSTVGTIRVGTVGTQIGRCMGFLQEASAHPLPATATFATFSGTAVPVFGVIMKDLTGIYTPVAPTIISPWSYNAIGSGYSILAASGGMFTSAVSGAWPAANRAIYYPFYTPKAITLTQAYILSGATWANTNHFDIGIYDMNGIKIFSTGSTLQNGVTNTVQLVNITDTQIGPGQYFVATSLDSTDTVFRLTVNLPQISGTQHETAGFPLNATATFVAAPSSNPHVSGFITVGTM